MKTTNRFLMLFLLAFTVLTTVNCAGKSNRSSVSRASIATTATTTSTSDTTSTGTSTGSGSVTDQAVACQGSCQAGTIQYQNYCLPTNVYGCGTCYGFGVATDGHAYCYLSSNYKN